MRHFILIAALTLAIVFIFLPGCKKNDNPLCAVPTGLSTSNTSGTSVTLHWDSVSSGSKYNIQYRATGAANWLAAADAATFHNITGLTPNTTYQWQVQTTCYNATSAYSATANFTTSNITSAPNLIFKFYFDSTQVRLNNVGQPATMPAGHAGLSPRFNAMSAHYIELAQDSTTQLGQGAVLYKAPQTTTGGASAITFDSSVFAGQNQPFFSIPISKIKAGSYNWLRVSLAYQNYDVDMLLNIPPYIVNQTITGTVASFVGFDTYIGSYKIKDSTVSVNANKMQGYWGFEASYATYGQVDTGTAAVTTVPNPISATSPIPSGSCIVTGRFSAPYTITGNETSDVVILVSLSVNKSFEFIDANSNGKWDVSATGTEQIVDMGLRGLIPKVQ